MWRRPRGRHAARAALIDELPALAEIDALAGLQGVPMPAPVLEAPVAAPVPIDSLRVAAARRSIDNFPSWLSPVDLRDTYSPDAVVQLLVEMYRTARVLDEALDRWARWAS